MKAERANEILSAIRDIKVAVYGDFCLDAYWELDPQGSEVSVETGLPAQAVSQHRYSPGGASNIVANLAALQPAAVRAIGAVGADIYGRELLRQLQALDVDTACLVTQPEDFDTLTFCKPHLDGSEQNRFDFGFFNKRTAQTDQKLLDGLREAMATADAVIINQQVPGSLDNDAFIDGINAMLAEFPDRIVLLDSRHYGQRFNNVFRKTNACEAAQLNGIDAAPDAVFTAADAERFAKGLHAQSQKPVFITLGSRGMLVCDASGIHEVPGLELPGQLDPVGAGDTTLSALACCLAAGLDPVEAAQLANCAAAVTVQKLFRTGTASPNEILSLL